MRVKVRLYIRKNVLKSVKGNPYTFWVAGTDTDFWFYNLFGRVKCAEMSQKTKNSDELRDS